jgi:hypothetical protein
MKSAIKIIFFTGAALTLAACGCPKVTEYGKTPYAERTAGDGKTVYEKQSRPVVREHREAEILFNKKQKK